MITIEHENGVLIVGVFGEFELADYQLFETEVIDQLHEQGSLSLLIDLRSMLGYTVDVALEDIRFTRKHGADIGRIAILSEREWVKWTALLTQAFVQSEIQVYDDEAPAREWLSGED
jgi:hypothetical protein